jgi:hypothetical protein
MHFDSVGGSGRDEPSEERMLAFARRINPPENEIPAAVATSALLARTDDVAIALIGAHAYTFGLRFDLVIRLRHEPRGAMAHKACVLLSAYSGREASDERLLLGVEYADGRTATNFQSPGFRGVPVDDVPDEPSLSPMGGGGGGCSFDQSFWLMPLPPAGPLVVVCAWSAFDIPESRTVLDGAGRRRHRGSGISCGGAVATVAAAGRGSGRTTGAAGPRGWLVRQGYPDGAGHRRIVGLTGSQFSAVC